jgi:peptidoglycan hydrolase CwlO-like protein
MDEEKKPWWRSFGEKVIGVGLAIGAIFLYFFMSEKFGNANDDKIKELEDQIENRNKKIKEIEENVSHLEEEDKLDEKKQFELELKREKLNDLLSDNKKEIEELKKKPPVKKVGSVKEAINFVEDRYKNKKVGK